MQVIRPTTPVFVPGEDYVGGNITVVYKGFQITSIANATEAANYCTQDVLFFCADTVPDLTGPYGLFSQDTRLQAEDYQIRELTGAGQLI